MLEVLPSLTLVAGIVLVAMLPLAGARGGRKWRRAATAAVLLAGLGGGLLMLRLWRPVAASPTSAELLPGRRTEGGYVTSQACQACHEAQFESWHGSYHRSMTQAVSPETVIAPFDGVTLETLGRQYYLSRRGDEFWANMPDPEWYLDLQSKDPAVREALPKEPPQVDRQIVMSTGSHHMQLYWVTSPQTRRMVTFPFIYVFAEQRWVPRGSVFLVRPHLYDKCPPVQMWNENCVNCHAVAGQPRLNHDEGRPDTRVAELGIACEACHGPGEEHIRKHSSSDASLLAAARREGASVRDATIINPARCDPHTSAQVCGRCHSVGEARDETAWNYGAGDHFRPGEDLHAVKLVLRDPRMIAQAEGRDPDEATATSNRQSADVLAHYFWPDGMIRVSGRDYNGLIESPCFQRGELSCVSCHSLHESDPDDQLAAGMRTNQACYQCHAEYEARLEEHTHHPAASTGSLCYNCHMPHTSYGLLKGIRSHQISNPTVTESTRFGRPNACNLCHLDQTLEWTGEHLTSWYGQPPPELLDEERATSAAVRWLLRGDAGQRAIVAWHLGWAPAREASGTEWMPPFLAELLVDPYSAVRYISYHSLEQDEAYQDLQYDFVGSLPERSHGRRAVLDRWRLRPPKLSADKASRLLLNSDGTRDRASFRRQKGQRDDRPIELWE